jgi:hypothetical protein
LDPVRFAAAVVAGDRLVSLLAELKRPLQTSFLELFPG